MTFSKRDKITDALEAFWGGGAKTNVPSPQVDTTPEDIIETVPESTAPQISRDIQNVSVQPPQYMASGGRSVREMVEEAIKAKKTRIDTQPPQDTGYDAFERYSPREDFEVQERRMPAPPPQPMQKNLFDIGGFDTKIAEQFKRERGGGIDLSGPMAPTQPKSKLEAQFVGGMSYRPTMFGGGPMIGRVGGPQYDPRLRRKAQFATEDYIKQLALRRQQRLTELGAFRSQEAETGKFRRELARSIGKQRQLKAFEAGLPVYESPLDPLFGGKRKVKAPLYAETYDPVTGKVIKKVPTGKFEERVERTPGFFGTVAGGLNIFAEKTAKTGKPLIKEVAKKGKSAYERGLDAIEEYTTPEPKRFGEPEEGEKSLYGEDYSPDLDRMAGDVFKQTPKEQTKIEMPEEQTKLTNVMIAEEPIEDFSSVIQETYEGKKEAFPEEVDQDRREDNNE